MKMTIIAIIIWCATGLLCGLILRKEFFENFKKPNNRKTKIWQMFIFAVYFLVLGFFTIIRASAVLIFGEGEV